MIGTYVAVDDEQVGGELRVQATGDGGEAQHLGGVRIRAVNSRAGRFNDDSGRPRAPAYAGAFVNLAR